MAVIKLFSFFYIVGFAITFVPRVNRKLVTWLSLGLSLLGGFTVLVGGIHFLENPPFNVQPANLPALGATIGDGLFPSITLNFYLDPLASFFMILIGILSLGIGVYSFGWLENSPYLRRIAGLFNLFVLTTLWVVIVNNAFFFLLTLETMTLIFSLLTLYRHHLLIDRQVDERSPQFEDAKSAFKTYLISNHIAAMFLVTMFLVFGKMTGSFDFSVYRNAVWEPHEASVIADLIFVLGVIGFGIKAAIAPFHIWLPLTHPYAPTNIHAMMSGLVIKVAGVYGLIRLVFEFLLPMNVWWWGTTLLFLGGFTAITGVFFAIISQDLKAALANHSIENIGIIVVGLGTALLLQTLNPKSIFATLALLAALYHLLNHAIFKGLLFLAVAAIETHSGSTKIAKLRGLMHSLPLVSTMFLVGAVSIAGFPPFNGFISEWLTLQSLFTASADILNTHNKVILIVTIVSLLLLTMAMAMTVVAFTKIIGTVLLGKVSENDHDKLAVVPKSMQGVLVVFAALCLLLGIFPGWVLPQLNGIACTLNRFSETCSVLYKPTSFWGMTTIGIENRQQYTADSVLAITVLGIILALVAVGMVRWRRTHQPVVRGVWHGGMPVRQTMQISSEAFSFLIWRSFADRVPFSKMRNKQQTRYYLSLTTHWRILDVFRWGYNRIIDILVNVAEQTGNYIQNGDIRRYLTYILIVFIIVMIVLLLSP